MGRTKTIGIKVERVNRLRCYFGLLSTCHESTLVCDLEVRLGEVRLGQPNLTISQDGTEIKWCR